MKQLVFVFFTLISLAGFVACKKNITVAPIVFSTPLQALIDSDTSLSVFYAAVLKARDTAMYGGTDSITVLIPTNTAFASQGITAATINAMTAAGADSMLRYHFIVQLDSLTTGAYVSYNSKLGPLLYGYGNADSSGNYFNGSLATLQTLRGSNAAVYELNTPLRIPASSIAQLIIADTSLTFFAEAIRYTNLQLTPAGAWNTVLAPNNAAFIAAGYPTLASIDNADPAVLTNILQYHVVPGQFFTNSFTTLASIESLQGSNINITLNNGVVQFTGNSNTTAAGIVTANGIAGTNTILHTINGVLLP